MAWPGRGRAMICYQMQSGELRGFTNAPTASQGLRRIMRGQKVKASELSVLARFRKVNKYRASYRIMGPWLYIDPRSLLKERIDWRCEI